MTINEGYNCIYANQISDEFGVAIASSVASTSRSGNSENRNIVTSKNTYNNHFNLHGVTYDNPLTLDLIFYNTDGSYFDAYKERTMKKWLMKNSYNWLQIDQNDLGYVSYFCIATEVSLIDVGTYTGAILCRFQCSDPWAWSDLQKKTYTTVNNTLSVNLNMDLDFDQYIVNPQIVIKSLGTGSVSIKNNTTNETVTFSNCSTNEIITYETDSDKLSSTGTNIISRWNKIGLSLCEGINNLVLTGNFSVTLSYRLPIRVGA